MKQGTRSSRKPGGAKERFGGERPRREEDGRRGVGGRERDRGCRDWRDLGLGGRNFQGGNPWKWKGGRESTGESGWTFPSWWVMVVSPGWAGASGGASGHWVGRQALSTYEYE